MKLTLSDQFIDESLLEKARWFSALSVEERIAWLDEWTERKRDLEDVAVLEAIEG